MQLSQKPECIDLMLHDDLKDDYSFRTNIQDIASLLSGILNIMQQPVNLGLLLKVEIVF